jgi:O-methyltransferase involved in polyketide biosynthesis
MERKRITITQGTVQETLLITLYARAQESLHPSPIINDKYAQEIFSQIDYEFDKFDRDWATLLGVVVRTQIIDELVTNFIQKHPNALIINLGAGLCTRFFRVDNGSICWYDLDLPEVTAFKTQFLSENHRYHYIAKSVFDFSWFDDIVEIKQIESNERPVLILAEGLFYYFPENDVKRVFDAFLNRFSTAEIILELAHPWMVKMAGLYSSVKSTGAKFQWGVGDKKYFSKWNPRFELINEYSLYKRHKKRWKLYSSLNYLPVMSRMLRVAHLKLLPN